MKDALSSPLTGEDRGGGGYGMFPLTPALSRQGRGDNRVIRFVMSTYCLLPSGFVLIFPKQRDKFKLVDIHQTIVGDF